MERGAVADHAPAGRRRKVLIVEDDFLARWGVAEYLRETGFDVIEAVNTNEAIAILSARITVDVVFCEARLAAHAEWHEFARWIAQQQPPPRMLLGSEQNHAAALIKATPARRLQILTDIEQQLAHLIERG